MFYILLRFISFICIYIKNLIPRQWRSYHEWKKSRSPIPEKTIVQIGGLWGEGVRGSRAAPGGRSGFGGPGCRGKRERTAIFDEQIRAGNPERQRGLAPLLEMVPSRKRERDRQPRGEGGALNAHRRRRVLHTLLDLSLCPLGTDRCGEREKETHSRREREVGYSILGVGTPDAIKGRE